MKFRAMFALSTSKRLSVDSSSCDLAQPMSCRMQLTTTTSRSTWLALNSGIFFDRIIAQ